MDWTSSRQLHATSKRDVGELILPANSLLTRIKSSAHQSPVAFVALSASSTCCEYDETLEIDFDFRRRLSVEVEAGSFDVRIREIRS